MSNTVSNRPVASHFSTSVAAQSTRFAASARSTSHAPTSASQVVSRSDSRATSVSDNWSPETNWVSKIAQDPDAAYQLARSYAYVEDFQLLDASDFLADKGPLRSAVTGQPITAQGEKQFRAMASTLREGRLQLFESEKAKGTPDAEVLDKLRSFMDHTASADYLRTIDWERISRRSAALTVFA